LFHRKKFVPEAPEIYGGTVQETIDSFDPGDVKHESDAAKLKAQWGSIRSKFTVAYKRWSAADKEI
jgi:hypothetical protein